MVSSIFKTVPVFVLISLPCVAAATDVFRLEGYGPISRAMGGTATAHDVGAAGMMVNPATLSFMSDGSQLHVGLDIVTADINARNGVTGEIAESNRRSKNRGPYVAPEFAYSRRDGQLSLGIGAFAQGGLGTEYGNRSFLSRTVSGNNTGLENSSRLLVLNIPFSASYIVNERLSVGGSLDAMWTGLNLNLLFSGDQIGSLLGAGRVQGGLLPLLGTLPQFDGAHISFSKNQPLASGADAWGVGGRLGLTYKMSPQTTLGAAYSFESKVSDLEGDATLTAIDRIVGQVPLQGKITVSDFQLPAVLNMGVATKLDDKWLISADLSYVFWKKAMTDINVNFEADSGGNIALKLPQNYKNQTILALGAAYRTGNWTVRGGARFATQALRSNLVFAVIPATPTKHLSAGLSYDISSVSSVHLAYSHAFKEALSNGGVPNTSAPIQVSNPQNNVALSYTYKF